MNGSWTNGESWKRPQTSNDLATLITRGIAGSLRAGPPIPSVVASGPFWQPLPTTTPNDAIVQSETWRAARAPIIGETWRASEVVTCKSEDWRHRDRKNRWGPAVGATSRQSDLRSRSAKDRERKCSPPPARRKRNEKERRSSRWEPVSRKSSNASAHAESPERRTAKVEMKRELEESVDDAAVKLEPADDTNDDDAWEARLNAALERDVNSASKSPDSVTSNPQDEIVFGFPDEQMPEDLIEIDDGQETLDDQRPSRSIPGLKFRGDKRLVIRAVKIRRSDVKRYFNDDEYKAILLNPPTLSLCRLTQNEMDQWKAEFPPSLPVFRKRRQRTSEKCLARSPLSKKQLQHQRLTEMAEKREQMKQRPLDLDDYFSDDGGHDGMSDDDDVKTSRDGRQQPPHRRPLLRRPPPPPEELPPGLHFLSAATQPLPSFKIKKKVPVKVDTVEDKWKKYYGGVGNRPKPPSEQPQVPKPSEGSVVDRARDKWLVDGFFDRNLGHYRQAVRPKVKAKAAPAPAKKDEKTNSGWSSKENMEKVSDWLSTKASDKGPTTPPGSGPDDSPAQAHVDNDDEPPAATQAPGNTPSKEEMLLAPDINPLDYVEELSNPGGDDDALDRQLMAKGKEDEPSSSFVWTGTDKDHEDNEEEQRPVVSNVKIPLLGDGAPNEHTSHSSQYMHSTPRTPILPSPVSSNAASFSFSHGRQPLISNGLLPLPDQTPSRHRCQTPPKSYGKDSVEATFEQQRPRSSSSGVRSGSPMDVEDDSETSRSPAAVVGRQSLLGGRPRALLNMPLEPPALLSTPSTPMLIVTPRPPKQPLIPTPSALPLPVPMANLWRPKAPLLTEIVPERPRLNGPVTKFVRPTPAMANSPSESPSSRSPHAAFDDDYPNYSVEQLRTILNILLKDPSSSLQNQHDRRLQAQQLLSILDEVDAMQLSQPTPLTQCMLRPIVQFVLDSSGLLTK